MAPTPRRIAQTSTEAKRQHKKGGPRLPNRQQKQLKRAVELDQRAARFREAEERRKLAKKKRAEKEQKEALARKQMGAGFATQLVGYSHTQAQLKNGMEAFLGVSKRKDEEKRKKQLELTRALEDVANEVEKEPWDDEEADNAEINIPSVNTSFGAPWANDDLDDDSLLEAHDSVLSDSAGQLEDNEQLLPCMAPSLPIPVKAASSTEPIHFVRLHGPINKAVETILDKLPEPLIELLSQDISMKLSDWDPPLGLLHKLNPVGIPPHRLRLKVGCVVSLLKNLNTSSQLSKSQHLRLIRVDKDRLECVVLGGQLEGTKTFLTRIPFFAKYKNRDQYPFQRTQFPIRVSTEHKVSNKSRSSSHSGFKLPTAPAFHRLSASSKPSGTVTSTMESRTNATLELKQPNLPVSKPSSMSFSKPSTTIKRALPKHAPLIDCWDDFLDSGTQIARELAIEKPTKVRRRSRENILASPSKVDSMPPLSTQDLEFSLDDLDEEVLVKSSHSAVVGQSGIRDESTRTKKAVKNPQQTNKGTLPSKTKNPSDIRLSTNAASIATTMLCRPSNISPTTARSISSELVQPQRPPSVSDRPGLKRKGWKPPSDIPLPKSKKPFAPSSRQNILGKPPSTTEPHNSLNDILISTQDVALFFDDDENLSLGSPPIQV